MCPIKMQQEELQLHPWTWIKLRPLDLDQTPPPGSRISSAPWTWIQLRPLDLVFCIEGLLGLQIEAGLHVSPRPQCFSLVSGKVIDQGGAVSGAGLHASSRLQLFSLVSGVKSLRRFYRLSFKLFFSVVVNLYCVKIQFKHKCELYFL